LIHQTIPKITDFGAGKEIGLTTSHKNGVMGAICYLDPQRCGDRKFNENYELQKPSDVYSLGVIFWQIFSGRNPFEHETRDMYLFEDIRTGKREIAPSHTPKRFVQLYETCWHSDPNSRLTIAEVVKRIDAILENKTMQNGIYDHLISFLVTVNVF